MKPYNLVVWSRHNKKKCKRNPKPLNQFDKQHHENKTISESCVYNREIVSQNHPRMSIYILQVVEERYGEAVVLGNGMTSSYSIVHCNTDNY